MQRTWRSAFTPWKAGICIFAFVLMLGSVAVLDLAIPGDTTDATIGPVDGGMEFTVKPFKETWLGMAFFGGFFAYPLLLYWWFWDRLSEEYDRTHDTRADDANGSRIGQVFVYGILGCLVAFFGVILVQILILLPLYEIHRVTVVGDHVRLESLYRSWEVSRRDVRRVDATRSVRDGRGGPGAEFRAVIRMQNGDRYRTVNNVVARPPGGDEDRRIEQFFAKLKSALM